MVKKLIYMVEVSIVFLPLLAEAMITFERYYGGTYEDGGICVRQIPTGDYIICGWSTVFGSYEEGYIIKVDSLGDTLWTKVYGSGDEDFLISLDQTSDSGYIFAGCSGMSLWIVKTNSGGDMLWQKTYGDTLENIAWCIEETFDGGYIVGGWKASNLKQQDVMNGWLLKLNNSGDTLWTKTYPNTLIFSAHQLSSGDYIFAGVYAMGDTGGWLVKVDTLGNTLWTSIYKYGSALSMELTADGGYILGGLTEEGDSAILIKVDANGDSIWAKTYTDEIDDIFHVTQTSDGGYVFTTATQNDLLLVKTDANGNILWGRIYGTPITGEYGWHVKQTQDGGYIITGGTDQFTGAYDVYLIKTDSLGLVGIEESHKKREASFSLLQNPVFCDNIVVALHNVNQGEEIIIDLYDMCGRLARRLFRGELPGERMSFSVEGVTSGIYFIKAESQKLKAVQKVVIIR